MGAIAPGLLGASRARPYALPFSAKTQPRRIVMPLPQVAETDRASSPPGAQSGVISGSLPQSGVVSRLEPQSGIISGLAETHQRSYARDGFLSFEGAVNR